MSRDELYLKGYRGRKYSPEDAEVNFFTESKLMPEELLREDIKNGVRGIEELAEKYGVPIMAIRRRLLYLGFRFK